MTKFEEFIKDYGKDIEKYFKNVSRYNNKAEYTEFNKECFKQMFDLNTYQALKSVKELKSEIPELTDECKKCGSYYINPRNRSIKGLDVQQGIFIENLIIDFLKKNKLNATHADKSNKSYPDCMILGPDKGVLAYFEVKYHNAPFILANKVIGRPCYEGSITLDYKKVERQLELIDSDLDRPVFFLHYIDYPCLKGIFFESSLQVKNNIKQGPAFEREFRDGDFISVKKVGYTKKIYSPLLEMGTFDEFVEMLQKIKKSGVANNVW